MYATPQSDVAAYLSSIEWFALTLFLFGLGIFLPALRIVPYLMLGGTLCVALSYMVRARIEPKFDTVPARLLVMCLAFVQPLVRGFSRYFTWLHFKRTPRSVIRTHEHLPAASASDGSLRRRVFWSEEGRDRHHLLGAIFQLTRRRRLALFDRYRLERVGHSNLRKLLVEHCAANRHRISRRRKMFNPGAASKPDGCHDDHFQSDCAELVDLSPAQHFPPRSLVPHSLRAFLVFLATRARALKSRVAELVDLAALRAGLQRIPRKARRHPQHRSRNWRLQ